MAAAVGFIVAWACSPVDGSASPGLAEFTGTYGSSLAEHERFGRELGAAFADGARKRLARARNARLVEWCTHDVMGMRTLAVFVESHERLYPTFMAELRGIAQGVGVSFEAVFALNLHQVGPEGPSLTRARASRSPRSSARYARPSARHARRSRTRRARRSPRALLAGALAFRAERVCGRSDRVALLRLCPLAVGGAQ
jgi:hypothetical protein